MSSHSSESETSAGAVGEDLKSADVPSVYTGEDESAIADTSRVLELLQEERDANSKDGNMDAAKRSQGYRNIQQSTEDMSDSSSVVTPRATAHINSPDGSVVSFQDDTPSVQVSDSRI